MCTTKRQSGQSKADYLDKAVRFGTWEEARPAGGVTRRHQLRAPSRRARRVSDTAASIERFLAETRIAVVGASNDTAKFGARVFAALTAAGYDAVPVNPRASEVQGVATVDDLSALRGSVRVASVITPPTVTEAIVAAAAAAGFEQLWLQPGAESDAALATATAAGIDVIAGGPCILIELGDRVRER